MVDNQISVCFPVGFLGGKLCLYFRILIAARNNSCTFGKSYITHYLMVWLYLLTHSAGFTGIGLLARTQNGQPSQTYFENKTHIMFFQFRLANTCMLPTIITMKDWFVNIKKLDVDNFIYGKCWVLVMPAFCIAHLGARNFPL